MNKKLFLKLGLGAMVAISSISFIACGQNTSVETASSSTSNISASSTAQNSVAGNEKDVSSLENTVQKTESKTEDVKQKTVNTQQKTEVKTESTEQKGEQKPVSQEEQDKQKEEERQQEQDKQHAQLKTVQEKENFYYNIMNDVMQKQIDYINSIEDPKVKQSVQSSISAAIAESTGLMLRYPEDSEIISTSLEKVTQGTK